MRVKSESEVAQSFLTLRDPMDCSLPGSFVSGIFQARVLEWGAMAFSLGVSQRLRHICVCKGLPRVLTLVCGYSYCFLLFLKSGRLDSDDCQHVEQSGIIYLTLDGNTEI